jgi:hypothetical protein
MECSLDNCNIRKWEYDAEADNYKAHLTLEGPAMRGFTSRYSARIEFNKVEDRNIHRGIPSLTYEINVGSISEIFSRLKKAEEGLELMLYDNYGEPDWKVSRRVLRCILDLEKQIDIPFLDVDL